MSDGGPAFPQLEGGELYENRDGEQKLVFESSAGMTLRDYFAGQALVGLLSCEPWVRGFDRHATGQGDEFKSALAEQVYAMADAMLKAREAQS